MHSVFVPPLLCSPSAYEGLLPVAWTFGSVAVADTRRGTSIPQLAERLLATAPQRFVLAGTSMGGYVALEVMHQAPERVAGLALISTSARPDSNEQLAARRAQSAMVERGEFGALVDAAFPALVAAGHESDTHLLALWRDMANTVGKDAFLVQQEAVMRRADSRPRLRSITCPTAVIHGSGDRLINPDNAAEMANSIPNATLTWIEDAGHFALSEQPTAAATAFAQLLHTVANTESQQR